LSTHWEIELQIPNAYIKRGKKLDPLTANIFEIGPMPNPRKFLAGPPLLPNSRLG
jgi:hypothetical protein